MLIEMTAKDFLAQTASSSPAPGGGSASALAGALGVALAEMVINLTVGKKKYADVSEELSTLLPRLNQARRDLETAVDRDTEAFNGVMAAYGMPKDTEEQKQARTAAIQAATRQATEVPLGVMGTCLHALELTQTVAAKGNRNSISDAGVAGLLLAAALEGAALNVKINLPSLPEDDPFRKETQSAMERMLGEKVRLEQIIQDTVAKNL
ncbi:MAG: methenyltetrahydrofolate cyclohydrolase [Candidatus Zixiibacteriota bacterium]|nr:MAG: methenyltetrahydrofolate cyclohydrolase [candidate division Zixibacteria bacterium]